MSMKIGVIGSGKIGSTTAKLFVDTGHEVMVANSRGPDTLADLVADLGPAAHAGTVEDAARFGDVVLVAIPLRAVGNLPSAPFAGKIVVDANNYYPQRDGHVPELDSEQTTSSEILAAQLPGARVVKSFNTMNFRPLGTEGRPGAPRDRRLAMYVAGDDADAKRTVSELIEAMGFAPVDTGTLRHGGARQQPGSPIYNNPMTADEAEPTVAALT
jgi:hypothetical protein